MATLQDYLGITKLRDAWPKWKANVVAVNNQVIAHIAGTADKHLTSHVTNDSMEAGTTTADAINTNKAKVADHVAGTADKHLTSHVINDSLEAGTTTADAINTNKAKVATHIAGTADKHSAQDITYTGDFAGKTEVKSALDQAKSEIDTIVVNASIDPEVAFARESLVKSKTFETLDARLEEDEQDLVTYKADNVTQINGDSHSADLQGFFSGLDPLEFYSIKFNNVYDISSTLLIDGKRLKLFGPGGFRAITNPLTNVLLITNCPGVVVNGLAIDGSSLAYSGMKIENCLNSDISQCYIHDIGNSGIANVSGLYVSIGCSNSHISDNRINTVTSSGISRGVQVSSFADTSNPSENVIITHNSISNISPASDGDGIVIDLLSQTPCYCIIKDNYLKNCLKRGIKVTGSMVQVVDNNIVRTVSSADGYACISIYGYDCVVTGNKGYSTGALFGHGIDIGGFRHIIANNEIINDISLTPTTDGIHLALTGSDVSNDDIQISNNIFSNFKYGLRGTAICNQLSICGNIFKFTKSNNFEFANEIHKGLIKNNMCMDTVNTKRLVACNNTAITDLIVDGNIATASYSFENDKFRISSIVFSNNMCAGLLAKEYRNGKLTYYKSSIPTTGTYKTGDEVLNTVQTQLGTTPNKYVVFSWLRLTTGSTHVLNTDWCEKRVVTGN